jgi:hypothetical protein
MTTATELAALRATFEAFVKAQEAANAAAAEDRKATKATVDQIARVQGQLVAEMSEVKPVTDMVSSLRAKLAGAMIVLGIIGALAWAGIQFFKQQIINMLGA